MKIPLYNSNILRAFYSIFLGGIPFTYNPLNLNTFHANMVVRPYSTYINYKLEENKINDILNQIYPEHDFNLIKTSFDGKDLDYFISINIYRCNSPIFEGLSKQDIVRCEINTYIQNKDSESGTLIMDYNSNYISMDPINLFKKREITKFFIKDDNLIYNSKSKNIDFKLNLSLTDSINLPITNTIDKQLIAHTDKVFYMNGIYDKVYYDSSLVNNKIFFPKNINNIYFKFLDYEFKKPHSIFMFSDEINFIGGIWHNLKTIKNKKK